MRARTSRAPLVFVSWVGWATIIAFVAACVAFELGALSRSATVVVLAGALLLYASIVSVLGRVM